MLHPNRVYFLDQNGHILGTWRTERLLEQYWNDDCDDLLLSDQVRGISIGPPPVKYVLGKARPQYVTVEITKIQP